MVYPDDIQVLGYSEVKINVVLDLLEKLGFLINYTNHKSELTPSQSMIFLALMIDTVKMSIRGQRAGRRLRPSSNARKPQQGSLEFARVCQSLL